MKTGIRRFAALCLSLAMALSLYAPAMADIALTGNSLTVTGRETQLLGEEIDIMRILNVDEAIDYSPYGVIDDGDTIEYSINIAWLPFVLDYLTSGIAGTDPVFDVLDGLDLEVIDLENLGLDLDGLLNFGTDDLQQLLTLDISSLLDLQGLNLFELILKLPTMGLDVLENILSGNLLKLDELIYALTTTTSGLVLFLEEALADGNEDALLDFAEAARVWAEGDGNALLTGLTGQWETITIPGVSGTVQDGITWDGGMVDVTFDDLDAGLYLVDFSTWDDDGDAGAVTPEVPLSDPILVNVPSVEASNITLKGDEPTLDKTVSTENNITPADNNSAQIGDEVTFQLNSTLPLLTGTTYTTFKYRFTDTLSEGLTFDPTSVSIMIDGVPLDPSNYVVSGLTPVVTPFAGNQFTITLNEMMEAAGDPVNLYETVDAPIVVTYTATINENAVVGDIANRNSAYLEWDNDGGDDFGEGTVPDESNVYTYQITIDKYDRTTATKKLEGAVFALGESAVAGADRMPTEHIPLMQATDAMDAPIPNTYRIATPAEIIANVGLANTVTTPAGGNIIILGLAAETEYYLHEVEAPDGYNPIAPLEIFINVDFDNNGTLTYELADVVYQINGTANTAGSVTVGVANGTGTVLPPTGSIGTIGLTALGVGVIFGGVVFTSRKRKKNR